MSELFKKYNKQFKISNDLEISIRNFVRKVYCAKTKKQRGELVIKFINFMEKMEKTELLKKYLVYLEESVLDRWSCCLKISTFRDHTTNYIEREFRETNKVSRNMCRITQVIENNHLILKNKKIDSTIQDISKENLLGWIKKSGKNHWQMFHVKKADNFYLVQSSVKNSHYQVSLIDFSCPCASFNGEVDKVCLKKKEKYGFCLWKVLQAHCKCDLACSC